MKSIKYFLMAFVCLFTISCTTVDSGEIGIKFHKWSTDQTSYGGVEGTVKGWVYYNPFTTSIFTYPTMVQRKNYDPFPINAKDASIFTMDPMIAYHINPDKACDIFVKYRKPIEELENGYIRTCINLIAKGMLELSICLAIPYLVLVSYKAFKLLIRNNT